MTPLRIACAADAAYVPHTAAMMHSVLAQSPRDGVAFHYLHGPALRARTQRRLEAMVRRGGGEITFHLVPDERVAGLPVLDFITRAMWYRVFLPELVPGADRVLYLDADTIAVDDLTPLWETDLAGASLAAVTNVFEDRFLHRPAELGLAGPEVYFNSGVILLNLDDMRRTDATQELLAYAREHAPELLWPDQDALNVVLGARRVALHPRWNAMNSVLLFPWAADVFGAGAVAEARSRPAIRHFEGPWSNKPWHLLCDVEGREDYLRHRRRTPWPVVKRDGVTPRNVLRRVGLT
jgi:lipopolysaccharide biosynthesis glycosyltransferase